MSNIIIPEFYGLGSSPAGWMWADFGLSATTATPTYPTNGRGGITTTIGSAMYGPGSPVTLYGITVLVTGDANQVVAIRNYSDSTTYFALTFTAATSAAGHFYPANAFRTVTFGAGLDALVAGSVGSGAFSVPGVDLYDGFSFRVNAGGTNLFQFRFWFRPQKLNA